LNSPKMSHNLTLPEQDMTGWWKCCNDDSYNNPALTTTKCSTCDHNKCDSCGTYTPPPTPAEVGQYSIDEVDTSSSSQGGLQYADPPQSLYASPVQPLAYPRQRPSLRDWWKCCQCRREVNSKLFGTACPDCGHEKCEWYCTNL
jgi:hypothetical protein